MSEFVMRKYRSYGELINAVFVFVRIHKANLLSTLFKVLMPFGVVIAVGIGLLMNSAIELGQASSIGGSSGEEDIWSIFGLIGAGSIVVLAIVVAFFIANALLMSYFSLVLHGNESPTIQEVKTLFKKKFWAYFGISMGIFFAGYTVQSLIGQVAILGLTAVFGVAGSMFGLLVSSLLSMVVYTATALVPYPMFLENLSASVSVSRIWNLIRGNFWRLIGLEITLTVVLYVLVLSLFLPVIITLLLLWMFVPTIFDDASNFQIFIVVVSTLNAISIGFGVTFLSCIRIFGLGFFYLSVMENKYAVSLGQAVKAFATLYAPQETTVPSSAQHMDSGSIGRRITSNQLDSTEEELPSQDVNDGNNNNTNSSGDVKEDNVSPSIEDNSTEGDSSSESAGAAE